MAIEVRVPKLGFSMNEGTIQEWLVVDGAQVSEGQPIYAIEAEKAVQEVEAPASGTIKIIGELNEVYEIGTLIAEIS